MKWLLIAALATATPVAAADPQQAFFAQLTALCGHSFEGRVVTNDPADASFAGQRLTMKVASCTPAEVRIPFTVGADRSRTWVIGRKVGGLTLKHDHRHVDGTEDAVSQYGGDTVAPGTATRQEFHVDQFSRDLFVREDRSVSLTNVWAIEVEPKQMFAYELRRPNRHFRVEFDLSKPLAP